MTAPERSLRVFLTGFRLALSPLCDDLARQPGIEFLGAARNVAEAERVLSMGDVDLVIQAAEDALPRAELAAIRERTSAPIVLLVEKPDLTFFDDALYVDVADVVVLPAPAERLAFALRKVARSRARLDATEERRAHTVTVFSPKGGTGKTVVAVNLATSIAKYDGLRVLLIDLDLQFGDAAIMLGIEPEQTLHELATAGGELDAPKFRGYVTRHSQSGLEVLPAPLRPEDGEQITEDKIDRLLAVAQAAYDVVVIDTSPFFHGPMLSTLDHTDDLLVVCSPEVPALKNVRLGVETLRLLNFPEERMRLCLNRADADVGLRRPEVEGVLGMPVRYELPNAPDVSAAVNRGTPLALASRSHEFSHGVREMSRSLLGRRQTAHEGSEAGDRSLVTTFRGLATGWLHSRDDKPADAVEGQA